MADDDELAELYDLETSSEGPRVPLAGYSRDVETLDSIRDEIRALRTDMVNTNPHVRKKSKFEPVLRPETAVERRRERDREAKLSSIADRMLPGG